MNAWVHTNTKPQISSTRSRGLGWRIHGSVEDTKLSTNKQHTLSCTGAHYQTPPALRQRRLPSVISTRACRWASVCLSQIRPLQDPPHKQLQLLASRRRKPHQCFSSGRRQHILHRGFPEFHSMRRLSRRRIRLRKACQHDS
jgi:hypothetical protein